MPCCFGKVSLSLTYKEVCQVWHASAPPKNLASEVPSETLERPLLALCGH